MKENKMSTVEKGTTVTLHYTGTFEDGTVFDSSRERDEPMTVTVGTGDLIEGFDDALQGMTAGESKTFTLEATQAYGDHDPDATTTLDRSVFPGDFVFTEGMKVPLTGPGGQPFLATITEINDNNVVADLNHPMAGKALTFEVEVLTAEDETTAS
jgi:peptidylprolyl isomerase